MIGDVDRFAKLRAARDRGRGDPLGLGRDPEASAAVVEAARARAEREETAEAWAEYQRVLEEHARQHGA